jgi:hypothetical protein
MLDSFSLAWQSPGRMAKKTTKPQSPPLVMVSFRASPGQVKRLKQCALDAGVSVQMLLQHFIDFGLKHGEVPP